MPELGNTQRDRNTMDEILLKDNSWGGAPTLPSVQDANMLYKNKNILFIVHLLNRVK